jgi:hypothetical protein
MLRSRLATRLLFAVTGIAVSTACVAIVSLVRGRLESVPIAQRPPKFRIERQKLPGNTRTLRCSPNGGAFCIVTSDNRLWVYTGKGLLQYSLELPDITAAVVTDDARYAAAYSEKDPSRTQVTFLNSSGRVDWKLRVRGAIWCADVFGDACEATFAIGTGEGYIYLIQVKPDSKRFRRFRVPGAVTSVVLDPNSQRIVFATWQRSSIGQFTWKGRRQWTVDLQPALIYRAHPSNSSDRILAYGTPLRPVPDGELCALRDGAIQWRTAVNSEQCLDVVFACDGDYICLAQENVIKHEGRSVREKHALLLDGSGRKLVDKGSLFFGVRPLMVTRDGGVLLYGNEKALFSMNSVGKLEKVANLPSRIVRSSVSRDGNLLLLECAGGILLRLTPIRI